MFVGGETAFITDFFDVSDQYNPIILALVLALSFVLLTVVFRSLVVPVKAILMNLLSVGAAYGLIVLVFQKGGTGDREGHREALRTSSQVESIEAWIPLFLFSILFGFSMDYHVFLLTRIREHYDRTGDNTEVGGVRPPHDGRHHHRCGPHHGRGVRRVRRRPACLAPAADGVRPGGRGLPGCHDREDDPRSVGDEAPRRSQLVPAQVAGVAAEARCRRPRGRAEHGGVPDSPAELVEAGTDRARGRGRSDSRRQSGSRERVFSLSSSRRTSRATHRAEDGRRVQDPTRLLDGRSVERAVPLPDLPERPRHPLLDLVAGVVRGAPDQREVGEELAVGRVLRPHGASRDHRERAALHEPFRSFGPRRGSRPHLAGSSDRRRPLRSRTDPTK